MLVPPISNLKGLPGSFCCDHQILLPLVSRPGTSFVPKEASMEHVMLEGVGGESSLEV